MKFLFTIFLLVIFQYSFSQTTFSTTILLPDSVALETVSITSNVGYGEFPIENITHQVKIKDTFVTKYGVITVYDLAAHYYQRFFLNSGESTITFVSGTSQSFVKDFVIVNSYSSQQLGEDALYNFAKKEIDTNDEFVRKYVDFGNQNDSIEKRSLLLEEISRKKQFEFIKRNSKLYYSLWLFKYNYVDSKYYDTEKLYRVFDKKFKKKYEGYVEADQIESILLARKNIVSGKLEPTYSVKDYLGNTVASDDLKGKYILINFWAPWCSPCIKEMPILAEIHRNYGAEKIRVISVNCDEDNDNFLSALKKYKMNWTNIPYNLDMIYKFGKFRSIPQVFLIDKTGKVIYSRVESKDYNLQKLLKIVENLN